MPPLPKGGMAELSEAGGIRSRRFRTFDNYKLRITNCVCALASPFGRGGSEADGEGLLPPEERLEIED